MDGVYKANDGTPALSTCAMPPDISAPVDPTRRGTLTRVTRRPLWIKAFGELLDGKEQLIELAFTDAFEGGAVRTEWVPRNIIASKQKIIALASRGVPVHEGNASAVLNYLDAALHHLATQKPEARLALAARTGSYKLSGDRTAWLVGSTYVGPADTLITADPRGLHSSTQGLGCRGAFTDWLEVYSDIYSRGPIPRFLLGSSFVAPLLKIIGVRTFIIHHWGASGSGKTAVAKFAMSAYGDPDKLMQTFNRTDKSFIELFRYMDDIPVMFDELQASKVSDHAALIYNLTLEKGRGRASREGGLQSEVSSWSTLVRMTGEEPIIGKDGIDLGGQANRVIQISAEILTPEEGLGLHQFIKRGNYGHAGIEFLRRLEQIVNAEEGVAQLNDLFMGIDHAIRAGSSVATYARGTQLAAVALAQALSHFFFFDAPLDRALDIAIQDAIEVGRHIYKDEDKDDLVTKALTFLREHYISNRHMWLDLDLADGDKSEDAAVYNTEYREMFGVLRRRDGEVWIVPQRANAYLRSIGINAKRIWSDMKKAGVLITEKEDDFRSYVTHGKFKARVYKLKADKFEHP
jgi:hypothetical protein